MANFSEKDALTLFKRTAPDDRPLCKTCKKPFDKNARNHKYCPACTPYHNSLEQWQGIDPPKRKRGQRGATHSTRDSLPPDDSDYEGTPTICPDCQGTYDPTIHGRKEPCNTKQWSEVGPGGVVYDKFKCHCGHTWDRYK